MSRRKQRSLFDRWVRHSVVTRFVTHDIWHVDVARLGPIRSRLTRLFRVVLISGRGFERDRCLQRAQALTYMTIFSLPAFLALLFSVSKGFGIYRRLKDGPIDDFLNRAFPQESGTGGAKIREVVDQLFAYVESTETKTLTTVALLFAIYATIKMLGATERAFNEIWGVQRARTLIRKFADYLAIVLIMPIVLLVGAGFTANLQAGEALYGIGGGEGVALMPEIAGPLLKALPILSIWVGMSVMFLTLPNTRVRLAPALFGGLFAAISWQLAQVLFLQFQVGLARLNAIFASFAAVPMLLTWIYFSWVAIFLGIELAAGYQNEALFTSIARTGKVDQRFREALAPRLAGRIAAAFLSGKKPPTATQLANDVGVAPRTVTDVLEVLVRHRLMAETTDDVDEGYLPARDPDAVTVLDLLHALRRDEDVNTVPRRGRLDERVDRLLKGFDEELAASLHNYTLRELALTVAEEEEGQRLGTEAEPLPAERPT